MSLWMISITTLSRGRLRNQCDSGEERGSNDRFDVYSARLPPHLLELRRLGDGLRSLIHVAQTARRQSHSSLVARLEEAERARIEDEDQRKPPNQRCIDRDKADGEQYPSAERRDSHHEPLAPLTSANVGDPL